MFSAFSENHIHSQYPKSLSCLKCVLSNTQRGDRWQRVIRSELLISTTKILILDFVLGLLVPPAPLDFSSLSWRLMNLFQVTISGYGLSVRCAHQSHMVTLFWEIVEHLWGGGLAKESGLLLAWPSRLQLAIFLQNSMLPPPTRW